MFNLTYYDKKYHCPKISKKSDHTATTDELLNRVQPFFDRMGFARFSDITDFDRIGIPVINAIRPFQKGMTVSHGKGITKQAAMASALMESVERFLATEFNLPYIRETYNKLKENFNVTDKEKLPLLKSSFFKASNPDYWTYGWDIVNNCEVMLPLSLVTMARRNDEFDSFFRSTNGLAASLDFGEVVSQALIEVIERDATTNSSMMSHYQKSSVLLKRVDTSTIKFESVKMLIEKIEKANVYLALFDCTVDTKVPTYECQLIDMKEPEFLMCKGMGSALNPERAMVRAVTEAAQARAVTLSGVREAFFKSEMLTLRYDTKKTMLDELNGNGKDTRWKWVDANIHEAIENESFEEDISYCIDSLKDIGLNQVIVTDITPEGYAFHAVRVVVPGLEGVEDLIYYTPGKRANEFLKGRTI